MDTRKEHDFLGELEIPNTAYYGVQTMRAKVNFPITGYTIHPELIRAMAIVKKSAAQANAATHQLKPSTADVMIEACDEIIDGQWHEQFIVDPIQGGAGTSINMNTNEVIANRALEILGYDKGRFDIISPNNHVNMAQSTNDSFPTAIHIAAHSMIQKLGKTMKKMKDTFVAKSLEFDDIVKMGRTHLQDAVPIRLGQEFEAYAAVVGRDITRIKKAQESLLSVNLGATAIGTGLNADLEYRELAINFLRKNTGYPYALAQNLIDGTQNTDVYTEVSSVLKLCMLNMSKISNDIRMMASGPTAGLGELILPARQPGSSIMPGKVNPVMLEVMNQVAFQVAGNDLTISMASEAGQFELNVMEPVLVYNLLQSLQIMNNVFEVFTEYCLKDIKANKERLLAYVENSIGIITAVSPYIGYESSSRIAREALATGKPVRELCVEYGHFTPEEIDKILSPYGLTTPGISGDLAQYRAKHHEELK